MIVVDNNSKDGTEKMVKHDFPFVKYIKLGHNSGIAGYNVGFRKAKGDYIVALDSDSYPHPEAITKMAELLKKNSDAGIVAFDVHTPTKKNLETVIDSDEVKDIIGYHGAGAGIRKEVFQNIGYWFEPFFLYFNEMDHALRATRKGFRIITSPAVRAFHKSSVVARPSRNAPYFYLRNGFWLVWRNFPLPQMVLATFGLVRMAVYETFHQRTTVYMEAMKDAFKNIFTIFRTRKPLDATAFKKVRIPLSLIFSRFG